MSSLADLAYARQERVVRVGDRAATISVRLWNSRITPELDASWAGLEPDLTSTVSAAQMVVAGGSTRYVAQADSGRDGFPVEPAAFGGVDASGRDLAGLLYGAVTTAKTLIGSGAGLQQALTGGAGYLSAMVKTATADTARSADLTAAVGRKYTHYVRVVQPGACSRCAILAGKDSYSTAFKRHPACRCTAMPVDSLDSSPARLFANPTDYFETLSTSEQDRIFTKAGAEAIRAGADPVAIVSARRGAVGIDYSRSVLSGKTLPNSGRRLERVVIGSKDGQPVWGYVTGEGTTIRGAFAKQQIQVGAGVQKLGTRYRTVKRVRLMPETIIDLTDDVELRRVLLRDAGYLTIPTTAAERASNIGAYTARRDAIRRADRATADAFYRSHGISL
jgi:hypothetical protein